MGLVKVRCWLVMFSLAFFVHSTGQAADQAIVPASSDPQTLSPVQLKPQIRVQPISKTKYTIDTAAMASFLNNIVMFANTDQYEMQPHILGYANSSSLGGVGDLAYATGADMDEKLPSYTILKVGRALVNSETDEELGLMTHVIGAAEVKQYGEPQIIMLTKSLEQIEIGARLIPRTALDLPATIIAKTPLRAAKGLILYVATATTGVGKSETVVMSLGERDGLQQGDLLNCMEITKQFSTKTGQNFAIEPTIFGEILVYKVMEKVSLGHILSSSRPVNINDKVAAIPKG